jgi:hypothetical protein
MEFGRYSGGIIKLLKWLMLNDLPIYNGIRRLPPSGMYGAAYTSLKLERCFSHLCRASAGRQHLHRRVVNFALPRRG